MNHVTFETACRLKYAGFSQPEFSDWQVWYTTNGDPIRKVSFYYEGGGDKIFIGSDGDTVHFDQNWQDWTDPEPERNPDSLVFAPTATDILRQLPDYWFLSVATSDPHGLYEMCINHEELAAAWLAIHEKK